MNIAITGATGFVGKELVNQLSTENHRLRCLVRNIETANALTEFPTVELLQGELADNRSAAKLADGCDVLIHSAVWREQDAFQANPSDLLEYARVNIIGTLELIEASIAAGVKAFIFVSTCAVHDHILDDRNLDENHPLWANSHYGAHKAAIEKFVHSYGLGTGFPICAVRPTAVYGLLDPIEK